MPISVGPRIPPPEKWAEKQIERSNAAGAAWLEGINAPKKDPIKAAIAANAKYKNAVQTALAEDRYKKGLEKIDSSTIAETANALGSGVFTQGISARKPKIVKAIGELHVKLTTHVSKMDALPVDTPEQRKEKMVKNLDGMIAIGKK